MATIFVSPANLRRAVAKLRSAATQSAAGLMSAADKKKLDGVASGANAYSLPTAGTTLGGVKTTSTVTNASGYTPAPIIGGVPYYRDTNTTYGAATQSAAGLMSAADKKKLDGVSSAWAFLAAHPVGSFYEGASSPSANGGTWQLMPNCGRTGWVWKRTA